MSRKAIFLPRKSIDSATFTGAYQKIGTPLTQYSIIVKIVNNSNVDVDVSVDGSIDHDICPAGSFVLYDFRANKGVEALFAMREGMQFYVKGSASSGSVYLVSIGEEE